MHGWCVCVCVYLFLHRFKQCSDFRSNIHRVHFQLYDNSAQEYRNEHRLYVSHVNGSLLICINLSILSNSLFTMTQGHTQTNKIGIFKQKGEHCIVISFALFDHLSTLLLSWTVSKQKNVNAYAMPNWQREMTTFLQTLSRLSMLVFSCNFIFIISFKTLALCLIL